MIRYRDNMTEEELAQLMAEVEQLDRCLADADAVADEAPPQDEDWEPFDPARWGWVDKNTGRP